MDYYEILEINKDASSEVIKAAYKALAKKYHPDNWAENTAEYEEKSKLLNEAYSVLSDTKKRMAYDERLQYSKTEYSESRYSESVNNNVGKQSEPTVEPKSPKSQKSFWRDLGRSFISYVEKQNKEIDNAYYKGMEISEYLLIQEFKKSKGATRWGYARAMEQKGLLKKDKDGKYIPTSKYHYYS